jgi:phage gp36-like protein
MSEYYSTQASIEARISSLRLAGYVDRDSDGIPDESALVSGFAYARGLIRGKLAGRYGWTLIGGWDFDSAPELIKSISDDLCIYQYYVSNPRFYEAAERIRTNALELLDALASGDLYLFEEEAASDARIETGRIPSDFDPSRTLDDMSVRVTWILPDARDV